MAEISLNVTGKPAQGIAIPGTLPGPLGDVIGGSDLEYMLKASFRGFLPRCRQQP
ncbi:MAG: hypothetical protein IIZ92_15115 [Aquincola sp.]|nr:hypothetical protein [Aquincola sp.]